MNIYQKELTLRKNVTSPFCNHYSFSRIFQVIRHAKCSPAIMELNFKHNPFDKKRKMTKRL